MGHGEFFYFFHFDFLIFHSRKLLERAYYVSINEWHRSLIGYACNATRLPDMTFYHVF